MYNKHALELGIELVSLQSHAFVAEDTEHGSVLNHASNREGEQRCCLLQAMFLFLKPTRLKRIIFTCVDQKGRGSLFE